MMKRFGIWSIVVVFLLVAGCSRSSSTTPDSISDTGPLSDSFADETILADDAILREAGTDTTNDGATDSTPPVDIAIDATKKDADIPDGPGTDAIIPIPYQNWDTPCGLEFCLPCAACSLFLEYVCDPLLAICTRCETSADCAVIEECDPNDRYCKQPRDNMCFGRDTQCRHDQICAKDGSSVTKFTCQDISCGQVRACSLEGMNPNASTPDPTFMACKDASTIRTCVRKSAQCNEIQEKACQSNEECVNTYFDDPHGPAMAVQGRCLEKIPCKNNVDCSIVIPNLPDRVDPRVLCQGGECKAPSKLCTNNSDCTLSNFPECQSPGFCVEPGSGCNEINECIGMDPAAICVPFIGGGGQGRCGMVL
ncbi:MAG: hypothetical protein V1754_02090 [Pseudomonadota bacterium]